MQKRITFFLYKNFDAENPPKIRICQELIEAEVIPEV